MYPTLEQFLRECSDAFLVEESFRAFMRQGLLCKTQLALDATEKNRNNVLRVCHRREWAAVFRRY